MSLLTGVMPASRLSFSDMITCVEFQGCVANVFESPTLQVLVRWHSWYKAVYFPIAYFVW